MKFFKNNRLFVIACYSFAVIAASLLLYFLLYRYQGFQGNVSTISQVLRPFVIGGFIAYVLNLFMELLEKKVFTKKRFPKLKRKHKRYISISITYVIFLFLLTMFLYSMVPQIYNSVLSIVSNAPSYAQTVTDRSRELLNKMNFNYEVMNFINRAVRNASSYITKILTDILPFFATIATQTFTIVVNILIGLIVSFYILLDKEKFSVASKKFVYGLLPIRVANFIMKVTRMLDNSVRVFLGAKSIDAVIIGIVFYIILLALGANYALLLAFILGLTNMIPWVGCFVGAVPTTIVLAFQSTGKMNIFLVALLIVTQIDGNIISPKIQGDKLGLSPFWIMLSLVLGGALFGFMGILLGAPVFSVIYELVTEGINKSLVKKNLPTADEEFMNLERKQIAVLVAKETPNQIMFCKNRIKIKRLDSKGDNK